MSRVFPRSAVWIAALAIVWQFTPPTAAQDLGKSNLSVGYGFIHDRTGAAAATARINYHPSLVVSFTGRDASRLGAVVEFGWAQGPANYPYPRGGLNGLEQRITVLAGVRISGHGNTTAFGQVLAGFALERFHTPACDCSPGSVQPGGVVVQPGGGVDVALGSRVGLRVQGDLAFGVDRQPRSLVRLTTSLVIFITPR